MKPIGTVDFTMMVACSFAFLAARDFANTGRVEAVPRDIVVGRRRNDDEIGRLGGRVEILGRGQVEIPFRKEGRDVGVDDWRFAVGYEINLPPVDIDSENLVLWDKRTDSDNPT